MRREEAPATAASPTTASPATAASLTTAWPLPEPDPVFAKTDLRELTPVGESRGFPTGFNFIGSFYERESA